MTNLFGRTFYIRSTHKVSNFIYWIVLALASVTFLYGSLIYFRSNVMNSSCNLLSFQNFFYYNIRLCQRLFFSKIVLSLQRLVYVLSLNGSYRFDYTLFEYCRKCKVFTNKIDKSFDSTLGKLSFRIQFSAMCHL